MHNKPKNARRLNTKMNMIVSIQCSFVVINWLPRSRFTRSVYGRKRSRYDRILPKYMWWYYDRISTWSYTEQHDRIQRKTEIVYGLRVLRQWETVFSPYVSVYETEIHDRNTITCKPSYFSVYGRLRPCLFDLVGSYICKFVGGVWLICERHNLENKLKENVYIYIYI
jgi:hypothetical protein